MEGSSEEDKNEVTTTTMEVSIEEKEDATRLSERLRRRRVRCVYRQTEVSTTTAEASIEEVEDTTRLSERLQPQRILCVYGLRVLTMTMAALEE